MILMQADALQLDGLVVQEEALGRVEPDGAETHGYAPLVRHLPSRSSRTWTV